MRASVTRRPAADPTIYPEEGVWARTCAGREARLDGITDHRRATLLVLTSARVSG